MTKTYSEQRQAAYFTAARKLYALAASVANDTLADYSSITSDAVHWASNVLESTAKKAEELENLGHEECITSARAESDLFKARQSVETARRRLRVYAEAGVEGRLASQR